MSAQSSGPRENPVPLFVEAKRPFGDFRYRSGHVPGQYTLLETVGGGVAMIDFDADGYLDLFFAGGGSIDGAKFKISGRPAELFRNELGSRFSSMSQGARLDSSSLYSHGATVLDYDQDGWPDLLLTGLGGQLLFQNLGDGTFIDRTEAAGLATGGWSTSAVAADLDSDGDVDIYVGRYCLWSLAEDQRQNCGDLVRGIRDSCPPQKFMAAPDLLLLSDGQGGFQDASEKLNPTGAERALGVLATDVNADGFVDVYVANDAGPNHLYLGSENPSWRNTGLIAGISGNEFGLPEGSMGIAVADFNGDQLVDLFVTNFELENNSLYENVGGGNFRHATLSSGLSVRGSTLIGFGTSFGDFDADGWEDLVVLNGSVFYHTGQSPYAQPALLFKNVHGKFVDASSAGGSFFDRAHVGRGLATGDLNNDGATDIIALDQEEPPTWLMGNYQPTAWLRVQLRRTQGCNPPIGARVQMQSAGIIQSRWVSAGTGYLSYGDERLLFPLNSSLPSPQVVVTWPNGRSERFENLTVNQPITLIEGQGVRP